MRFRDLPKVSLPVSGGNKGLKNLGPQTPNALLFAVYQSVMNVLVVV